jgi:hypothetical protein
VWLCPAKRQICYCEKCEKKEGQASQFAKSKSSLDAYIDKYTNGKTEKYIADSEQQNKLLSTIISEITPTPTPVQLNCLNNDFMKFIKNNLEKQAINKHLISTQSVLDYNYYVLKEYVEKKEELTKAERDHTLIILWKNLSNCAKYFDYIATQGNINDSTTINQLYSNYKKMHQSANKKQIADKKTEKKKPTPIVEIDEQFNIVIYKSALKKSEKPTSV